jgi:predicted ester cyclase
MVGRDRAVRAAVNDGARTMTHLDTVRTYYRASGAFDWGTAAQCLARGYAWVDHGTGFVARTTAELEEAKQDASAYSDIQYEIEHELETVDGVVVIQGRHICTLAGPWRGMEAFGQTVSFAFCSIFRFDDDDLIVFEDKYYDMHSVRRQLGY